MPERKIAAIVGGGVIGGGWAARFLLAGWSVKIHDPSPSSRSTVRSTIDRARRSYPALYDGLLPGEGKIEFSASIADAAEDAEWIQESVPEQLDTKRRVFEEIQKSCPKGAILASSTSGFMPTDLQSGASRPDELIVVHPYNPVYLLPIVEVVPSRANSRETVERAKSTLLEIGMKPLVIRREIDAHVGDRLLEALWREALWLINDDIATTSEIDEIMTLGFGLRWAQMGLFETYRIAGGKAGMAHFIEQFGPCLKFPWTRLMDVPAMSGELASKIGEQSDAQSGQHSIEELEEVRDANLVTILRGLKSRGWAAGKFLLERERMLTVRSETGPTEEPVITAERIVPPDWIDYNNHMNEARYLEVFSVATDRFLETVGCDQEYVSSGKSFFTVETALCHFRELRVGERIRVETFCLHGEGKKLHLYHLLTNGEAQHVATGEHLLIHIDLNSRKSSFPDHSVASAMEMQAAAHASSSSPTWIRPKLSFDAKSRGKDKIEKI